MSKQLKAQLLSAAIEVRDAIRDVGANPVFHQNVQAKHHTEWPLLWNRLYRLIAVVETIQKREKEETGRSSGW